MSNFVLNIPPSRVWGQRGMFVWLAMLPQVPSIPGVLSIPGSGALVSESKSLSRNQPPVAPGNPFSVEIFLFCLPF